jgi:DNA polymerase-1
MGKLVLIDGNSILNRAFYGIMGSKMLTTKDGKYTNAVYGFLAILFKVLEDIKPEYIAVAFDLKAPTARHKMYEGYKANRKGMPNELAEQMPIVKEILTDMNITIIEKETYEADDILGTLSKEAEKKGLDVVIVSGDRDTFQLASNKVTIRIPHTKVGKTEVDYFDETAIVEKYGIKPKQLIEVKGLMGDTSDNIPGVSGIGEKTALELIKKYGNIDKLYKAIEEGKDDLKPKTKEKLIADKEMAYLSKTLGTINREVPLENKIDDLKVKEWNKEKVVEKFKELNFNRFMERFNLKEDKEETQYDSNKELFKTKQIRIKDEEIEEVINKIKKDKKIVFSMLKDKCEEEGKIIHKKIKLISIYNENKVFSIQVNNEKFVVEKFKDIFEDTEILKFGHDIAEDYVILKQIGITMNSIFYDTKIAAYDLNPTESKYTIEDLSIQYLNMYIEEYLKKQGVSKQGNRQLDLFTGVEDENNGYDEMKNDIYSYCISKIYEVTKQKLEEENLTDLFNNIEMPLVKVLGEMQFNGMPIDKEELISFGNKLKEQIESVKQDIYNLVGEEFNINSTQQLGKILFEKLKLPVYKKTKTGYSTDSDILEKLLQEHPVIEKILEYRSLVKLNSTYVEGLIPYINPNTQRIHSYFHQTITATGRISSTEPNLQNIPTRMEQGKQIRKAFNTRNGNIFIDADYSQIELRVLAHISKDEHMIEAFKNNEDIHKQAASKVLGIPIEDVTKEQRSEAKAVNFGIVYGISDYGLAQQLGISNKKAKEYIKQYLEKYSGVKAFMDNIVEKAKEDGYVETLFHRRRYIPELKSNNYMIRQFGSRAAMNTPIQGTAADIMKIAMIDVFNKLQEEKLDAKLVLQIHDELIIECNENVKERVKEILEESMESATKLDVPLKVETSEATSWYDVK